MAERALVWKKIQQRSQRKYRKKFRLMLACMLQVGRYFIISTIFCYSISLISDMSTLEIIIQISKVHGANVIYCQHY